MDADLDVCHTATDEDIVEEISEELSMENLNKGDGDSEDDKDPEEPLTSIQEVRVAMATVRTGLLPHGFSHHAFINEFETEVNSTLSQNLTQSTIERFFSVASNERR